MTKRSVNYSTVWEELSQLLGGQLHNARLQSLANAVVGVLTSDAVSVVALGRGLAEARGLSERHCIKQVDRMLSNERLDVREVLPPFVAHVLSQQRGELPLLLERIRFPADEQDTIIISLQVGACSLPLAWRTVPQSISASGRKAVEDDLLGVIAMNVPEQVRPMLLLRAEQFDAELLRFLASDFQFGYIAEVPRNIMVEGENTPSLAARELLRLEDGLHLSPARLSKQDVVVGSFLSFPMAHQAANLLVVSSDAQPNTDHLCFLAPTASEPASSRCRLAALRADPTRAWGRVSKESRRDRLMLVVALAAWVTHIERKRVATSDGAGETAATCAGGDDGILA